MFALTAKERNTTEKLAGLRKGGMIPAVVYGPKQATESLTLVGKEFIPVYREAGESSVITLHTPAGKKSVLIHDVQLDPVTSKPIHADFYAIEAGKEVEVDIPMEFVGVSNAVKSLGGTLVKVMHELSVKGMPDRLPHEIIVDISPLETLESSILIKDIKLPEGIVALGNPDDAVVLISVTKEEEEVSVPIDLSSIEVEKKGKKEEEAVPAE